MKESEIRPQALLDRYLALSAADARRSFTDVARVAISCVACDSGDVFPQFEKLGFGYGECHACGTLFQSPRPPLAAFEAFYRDSESSRYWAEEFFPKVAEVRRQKIFRPRVDTLQALVADVGTRVDRLIDAGAGFGIFLDEWRKSSPSTTLLAVEPSESLAAECRRKGFDVVEALVEHVTGRDQWADVLTCFEVVEHVHAPVEFVERLACLVRPGGWVLVSTLCIDGFDLQMLRERSTQISPPHHINFMSVTGLRRLFERAGLIDVRVTTPGRLDVDIVRNYARQHSSVLDCHRFLRHVLADDRLAAGFQEYLVSHQLSSHAWVMGRVPQSGDPA